MKQVIQTEKSQQNKAGSCILELHLETILKGGEMGNLPIQGGMSEMTSERVSQCKAKTRCHVMVNCQQGGKVPLPPSDMNPALFHVED